MNNLICWVALFLSLIVSSMCSFHATGKYTFDKTYLWIVSPYLLQFLLFYTLSRFNFAKSLAITSTVVLVFTILFYVGTFFSHSSTAGLIFLFGPYYLVILSLIVLGFSAWIDYGKLDWTTKRAKKKISQTQCLLVILHFTVFLYCALLSIFAFPDMHLNVAWYILMLPDFPAATLLYLSYKYVPGNITFAIDNIFRGIFSTQPYNDFWRFWYILFAYGILGSVWWFYVPLFAKWFRSHSVLGNDERLR